MAIEIIPKPKIKVPEKKDVLFYFSLIFLALCLASYFFLDFKQNQALKALEALEQRLTKEKTEEEITIEQEVLDTKNKIERFSVLISSHQKSSNIFQLLEKLCHPQVFFSDFDFNVSKGDLLLEGRVASFEALGQQLLILEREKLINKVELTGLGLAREGGLNFSIRIFFSPQVLK